MDASARDRCQTPWRVSDPYGFGRLRGVTKIELRSDNTAGVVPEILAAVTAANVGTALAYGGDEVTARLETVVREVFEHPTARVFP